MSAEEYQEEPAEFVDYVIRFEKMDHDVEAAHASVPRP